jgi:hypothetical protein
MAHVERALGGERHEVTAPHVRVERVEGLPEEDLTGTGGRCRNRGCHRHGQVYVSS